MITIAQDNSGMAKLLIKHGAALDYDNKVHLRSACNCRLSLGAHTYSAYLYPYMLQSIFACSNHLSLGISIDAIENDNDQFQLLYNPVA